MADLIIKPATGASNSLLIKDQAGGAVITTGTSGATIASATLTSPILNTGISGTAILDEDAMGSDSDTKLATQQSIKAYADTKAPIADANATHSGEVTGATALTITDDIVDEANLKISNAGSNGQFLSKQSGNTGGLTWATVADPTTGIADTNFLVANANVADNDFLRVDGTSIEGRTATEVLSDLGSGSPGSGNFLRGDGSWQTAGSTSAADLVSGTLPMARLSGTLPALNGSALTNLPASSGWVKLDEYSTSTKTTTHFRLGSGTTLSTTYQNYMIIGSNVIGTWGGLSGANQDAVSIRFYSGASTIHTAADYMYVSVGVNAGGGGEGGYVYTENVQDDPYTRCSGLTAHGLQPDEEGHFIIHFNSPTTSKKHTFHGQCAFMTIDQENYMVEVQSFSGGLPTDIVLYGFDFSGRRGGQDNAIAGNFALYGLTK